MPTGWGFRDVGWVLFLQSLRLGRLGLTKVKGVVNVES